MLMLWIFSYWIISNFQPELLLEYSLLNIIAVFFCLFIVFCCCCCCSYIFILFPNGFFSSFKSARRGSAIHVFPLRQKILCVSKFSLRAWRETIFFIFLLFLLLTNLCQHWYYIINGGFCAMSSPCTFFCCLLKWKTDFVLLACVIKPRFFMPNQLFPSLGGFVFFLKKKLSDLTLLHQFRTAVTMTE